MSESWLERLIFAYRPLLLLIFIGLSVMLALQAIKLRPDASFAKMIPVDHPFVQNFFEHQDDLSGLGNVVRIAVAVNDGDIFTADYQQTLKELTDEVFFIPGVDRSALKSLWTPNVRWKEVTEEGYVGGPVIPDDYDGSPASLEQLRMNVLRSGQVGRLVANNFHSTIIYAPLFDVNPETGERLDYQEFSSRLETLVREKYQNERISIHITGFAKVVGDLIDGAGQVVIFFAIAVVITGFLLYAYTRCLRSATVTLSCSLLAVIWQLGILHWLGYGLDPYSMLVPFLVFAIAVSHGVQIVNGMLLEGLRGADKLMAARLAFRSIYIPGLTALVSDAIGFVTLMIIDIGVIQELAVAASIGVGVIVFTNLVLLPIVMSYLPVNSKASLHLEHQQTRYRLWTWLQQLTYHKMAVLGVSFAGSMMLLGLWQSQGLQIGDLDPGAPELRKDSRYNLDNAFMAANYSTSSDVFVVMVTMPAGQCASYTSLDLVDRFQWEMNNVEGVQSVASMADVAKLTLSGMSEGSLKWQTLSRNQYLLNNSLNFVPQGMVNSDCSLTPLIIFLNDHKAETLQRVVSAAQSLVDRYSNEEVAFLLAAGNAGIEAATNEVIAGSQHQMLALVYAVVALLCFITFRSWRTVVCILLPLAFTSVMCQALMAWLGIGIKVATLPVIALGVGIGVDYGIYIYSKLEFFMKRGLSLPEAYLQTLRSTGRAVAFTGFTLAIGVATWMMSPIKFQADMGILLTFMFLWNMLGALTLIPALARFLIKVPKAA
jgi:predicted RND superfamily exporter protein